VADVASRGADGTMPCSMVVRLSAVPDLEANYTLGFCQYHEPVTGLSQRPPHRRFANRNSH
jgi:hypothetical protein